VTGGLSIEFGGAYVVSGGVTIANIGVTVDADGVAVDAGGMMIGGGVVINTITSAGRLSVDTLRVDGVGLTDTGGMRVANGVIVEDVGVVANAGGGSLHVDFGNGYVKPIDVLQVENSLEVYGGLSFSVRGNFDIVDDGLLISAGGLTISNSNPITETRLENPYTVSDPPSDRRLKTSVSRISEALHKVSLLNGVNFKWTHSDPTKIEEKRLSKVWNEDNHIGVIAQEVERVLPEAVRKDLEVIFFFNFIFVFVLQAFCGCFEIELQSFCIRFNFLGIFLC
jgi:hypothetical protein